MSERIADALEALLVRMAHDANHVKNIEAILVRIEEKVGGSGGTGDGQQPAIDAAVAKLKANNDRTEAALKH